MTEETSTGQMPDLTAEEQELDKLDDESNGQDGDPLDKITDVEELRAKTKAYRSSFKKWRKVGKTVKPPETKTEVKTEVRTEVPTDVVRKSDMERVATAKAKELLAQEKDGQEILAVYEELVKIPLGDFDPLNERSIAGNLRERYEIYRKRNPDKAKKPDTSALSSTANPTGTGGQQGQAPLKHLNLGKKPKDWYPPKQEA